MIFPKYAAALLLAAGGAFAACFVYVFFGNPEILLWKKALTIKRDWARKIEREHGAKYVIFGGSSCAFSIDGQRMERQGFPAVNMGMLAGMGATMITNCAVEEARPGDTLIVALEPVLLLDNLKPYPTAIQLSYAMGRPSLLRASWIERPDSRASEVFALRPGAQEIFSVIKRKALGMPAYRYSLSDIHPSGWMTTPDRRFQGADAEDSRPAEKRAGEPVDAKEFKISPAAQNLLQWVHNWCDTHQVNLVYSLPWRYRPAEEAYEERRMNLQILRQIQPFMPVLKDPALGTCSDRSFFADTAYHLTAEAAAFRTDSLVDQLKNQSHWTQAQLDKLLAESPQKP